MVFPQSFDDLQVPDHIYTCKKCGKVVMDGKYAKFCSECGRKFPWKTVKGKSDFSTKI